MSARRARWFTCAQAKGKKNTYPHLGSSFSVNPSEQLSPHYNLIFPTPPCSTVSVLDINYISPPAAGKNLLIRPLTCYTIHVHLYYIVLSRANPTGSPSPRVRLLYIHISIFRLLRFRRYSIPTVIQSDLKSAEDNIISRAAARAERKKMPDKRRRSRRRPDECPDPEYNVASESVSAPIFMSE